MDSPRQTSATHRKSVVDTRDRQARQNSGVRIVVSCREQVGHSSSKEKLRTEQQHWSADEGWKEPARRKGTLSIDDSSTLALSPGETVGYNMLDKGYEGDDDASVSDLTASVFNKLHVDSSEMQATSSEENVPDSLVPVLWPSSKLEERHRPMLRTALVAQHRINFLRCNKAILVDEKVSVFVNEKLKCYTEIPSDSLLTPGTRRLESLPRSKSVTLSLTPSIGVNVEHDTSRIICRLEGEVSMWEPSLAPAFMGRQLHFMSCRSLIEVSSPEDRVAPSLQDVVALDDGHRLVVADRNNACIKVLDESHEGQWSLKTQAVHGNPWSVSAFNSWEVVVTLPAQQKLDFVKLPPAMRVLRSVRTMRAYTGVAALDQSYMAVTYYGQPGGVDILDRSGTLHTKISPNVDVRSAIVAKPRYACVAANGDLLVTDCQTHNVICFTLPDSQIRWIWSNPAIRRPMGVCCVLEWGNRRKMMDWTICLVDSRANVWRLSKQFNRVEILRKPKDASGLIFSEARGITSTTDGRIFITQGDNHVILGLQ